MIYIFYSLSLSLLNLYIYILFIVIYIYIYKGGTVIFLNGTWLSITMSPTESYNTLIANRRSAIIPIYTSISWEIRSNIIFIYTDAGRLSRPVYYVDPATRLASIQNSEILPFF